MNELNLLLEILRGANLLTPAIAGVIGTIRRGRDAGKTDDEIKAESMAIAQETKTIADEQLNVRPTQ